MDFNKWNLELLGFSFSLDQVCSSNWKVSVRSGVRLSSTLQIFMVWFGVPLRNKLEKQREISRKSKSSPIQLHLSLEVWISLESSL